MTQNTSRSLVLSAALAIGFFQSTAQARLIQCNQIPDLTRVFLSNHLTQKQLTDTMKKNSVTQFIKMIDPSRTILQTGDVETLQSSLVKVFDAMNEGNCSTALNDVYKLLVDRSKENEAFVKSLMTPKYKIDESVQISLDPEKRGYPKTKADREKLLTALIHFQMSNYMLAKPNMEESKKMLTHRYELITKRVTERGSDELYSLFMEAVSRSFDPHTAYMPKDESDDFQIQMNLSLEGIGVSLSSQDGYVTIEEIIPGGSADRSKQVKPQDKITAVAQEVGSPVSVIDMDIRDVVKLIRGKKGTKVKLTILRQADKTQSFNLTLTREKIDIKEQAAKMSIEERKVGDKKLKIAIIDLPAFYGGDRGGRSCFKDMQELVKKATAAKVDGMILDLSRNGGGLLNDAVKIAGLFIKKGPVVATQDSRGNKEVLSDDEDSVAYTGPLLLLTSRLSASASEILAGALKDYNRALIVGADHTFGKGSVQVFSGLPLDLGSMKVTTGMYYLPKGQSTQHQGVLSDITLPSLFSDDSIGEKTLEYSLPPTSIAAFDGKETNGSDPVQHWNPVDSALVTKLRESSKKRVAQDSKFQDLIKEIQDMEKNKGMVKLADLRKKSETDKKKTDQEKERKRAQRKQLQVDTDNPQMQESLRIMQDWLTETAKASAAQARL